MHLITKILRVLWIRDYRVAFLRTRVAASTEHDAILHGLNLDTVVDIGANRGQFALCARKLFPQARIFSFEPLQKPAQAYRKTFERDRNVRLFNIAIGTSSGPAAMHVSRWDVSSSLLPIGKAQQENFPLAEEAWRETVSVARLDECLEAGAIGERALLKLDVQGFELTALQGCENLLRKFTFVYVEASFIELYDGQALATDVISYLLDRGFKVMCVANLSKGNSIRPIQADFLFCV